jgi:hypothetical protein
MDSSTSRSGAGVAERRQTAADRPGVAQPVPVRPVPDQPWGRILLGALVLLALLMGGWEAYWRAFGVHTGTVNNSLGLWAQERRRIAAGEGDATVLLGASRLYFDVQLPVWERLAGRRPVQLSIEGTSPLEALEDLAADPQFHGRVVIGVAPNVFFTGRLFRGGAARYAQQETPSQHLGQWLAMHLVEPYFAFDDFDFALQQVLARQPWPARAGGPWRRPVRKLADLDSGRNAHLWDKVENDPEYRALAESIWTQEWTPRPDDPTPEQVQRTADEQIARAAKVVAAFRARGIPVVFVRPPSDGEFLAYENRRYPRERTWDALLAKTGAPGIHFEDYPELAALKPVEWSHLGRADAERFTEALYRIIARDVWPAAPLPAR